MGPVLVSPRAFAAFMVVSTQRSGLLWQSGPSPGLGAAIAKALRYAMSVGSVLSILPRSLMCLDCGLDRRQSLCSDTRVQWDVLAGYILWAFPKILYKIPTMVSPTGLSS
jgi:hypothetical protein